MTDQTTAPAFLTVAEAARRLGLTRQAIHQRIKAGTLKADRVDSVTAARFHYVLPADQFGEARAYAAQDA